MNTGASSPQAAHWIKKKGLKELELLLRVLVSFPTSPILILDDEAKCLDANRAALQTFGRSRGEMIGQRVGDLTNAGSTSAFVKRLLDFQNHGTQEGSLQVNSPNTDIQNVVYAARGNVLPSRHILLLDAEENSSTEPDQVHVLPSWLQDYGFYLLDRDGLIVDWFSGANRILGYSRNEAIGQHLSFLHPGGRASRAKIDIELQRASAVGHIGSEGWRIRKDRTKLWANVITMALKDDSGDVMGFAGVLRDFSDRRNRDEELRDRRKGVQLNPSRPATAGVTTCEFDQIPEMNEALLELVGHTREDLASGRLRWSELTPPADAALDELAFEEAVRFGACTPYEKLLIRKDGARILILSVTAVLSLSPFRWITFMQEARHLDRIEGVEEPDVELTHGFEEMKGSSSALRRVQRHIEVVSPTDANVLILGETGTGKELMARAIHKLSPRKDYPFVTLNCAAIPTGLLESELFGYEKGAFTGALSQKIGRFEMAHRGTLFLDEVGDIPLELQPKLLRALQEKSFERLGGTRTIPIDIRLVAATNRNLPQMMSDKLFRSDLYYRLKVFPITMPPLRDHPEDIPILVRYFTKKYASQMGRQIDQIPADTMRALINWHWPGNVRELENFIERSVILSQGSSLRAPLGEIRAEELGVAATATLEQVERDHIIRVLREVGGVVSRAAARLGMPRTTLNAMMRKLGISRKDI